MQPTGRFVVQEHDTGRGVHFDLMIEDGEGLATWSLERPPDAGDPIPARRLGDHRRRYLAYEGPISGGRGRVRIWDAGSFRRASGDAGIVELELSGARLRGRFTLEAAADVWTFRPTPPS